MNASHLSSLFHDSPGSIAQILESDEISVEDSRSNTPPRQLVEQKLIEMLKGSPIMVSQIQRRLVPGRPLITAAYVRSAESGTYLGKVVEQGGIWQGRASPIASPRRKVNNDN